MSEAQPQPQPQVPRVIRVNTDEGQHVCRVYVDGKDVSSDCYALCPGPTGWADVYLRHPDGSYKREPWDGPILKETLHGNVTYTTYPKEPSKRHTATP